MDQLPYVILTAIAFDDSGTSALHAAASELRLRPGAALHLVHVLDESPASAASGSSAHAVRVERAEAELRRRIDLIGFDASTTMTVHIRAGSASECIVQTARKLDADVIIMGTRKRRGVDKLVHGSVAQRVLRHAHCPVYVVMPKDHATATPDCVEPACPDCVASRHSSKGVVQWCERHSRAPMHVHVYEPSDTQPSILVR